jgi:hypothetical protein
MSATIGIWISVIDRHLGDAAIPGGLPFRSSDFPIGYQLREGRTLGFVENVHPASLPRGHGIAEPITWTPSEPNFYLPANITYVPPARHFIIAESSAPFNFLQWSFDFDCSHVILPVRVDVPTLCSLQLGQCKAIGFPSSTV